MSDKQHVQAEYEAALGAFRSAIAGLSDEQMAKPFLDSWSVREVVGHLAGWHDQLGLGLERMAQGMRPAPDGVDLGDIQGFNKRFAADVATKTPSALLNDFDRSSKRFTDALAAIPDDRFGEGKTVNRIAAGAGYEHLREHADEIAAARAAGKLYMRRAT